MVQFLAEGNLATCLYMYLGCSMWQRIGVADVGWFGLGANSNKDILWYVRKSDDARAECIPNKLGNCVSNMCFLIGDHKIYMLKFSNIND